MSVVCGGMHTWGWDGGNTVIWKSHPDSAAFIKFGWERPFWKLLIHAKYQLATAVCQNEKHPLQPGRRMKCCYAFPSPDLLHVLHWNLFNTWWTLHWGMLQPARVRKVIGLIWHPCELWDWVETFLSKPQQSSIQCPGNEFCCVRQQDDVFIMRSEIFIKTDPFLQLGTGRNLWHWSWW